MIRDNTFQRDIFFLFCYQITTKIIGFFSYILSFFFHFSFCSLYYLFSISRIFKITFYHFRFNIFFLFSKKKILTSNPAPATDTKICHTKQLDISPAHSNGYSVITNSIRKLIACNIRICNLKPIIQLSTVSSPTVLKLHADRVVKEIYISNYNLACVSLKNTPQKIVRSGQTQK